MLPPDDPLTLLQRMEIPAPDATRRADSLLKANLAYRQKFADGPQKSGWLARLLGRSPSTKEHVMRKISLTQGGVFATVALIALATALDYTQPSRLQHSGPVGYAQYAKTSALVDDKSARPTYTQLSDSIDNVRGSVGISLPSAREMLSSLSLKGAIDAATSGPSAPVASRPAEMADAERMAESFASANVTPMPAPVPSVAMAPVAPGLPSDGLMQPMVAEGGNKFANLPDQTMQEVAQAPVSTFSADTDTASYTAVRRMIEVGQLPPADAVRTEEFLNYFHYNYALPEDRSQPFAPTVAVYPNPWNPQTKLMHVGIKAYDLPAETRKPVNLVLLIDVSGSMSSPDKLELAKKSFALMLDKMQPSDVVSIVTYAGYAGVALPPTSVENKDRILATLNSLGAGGGTAGAAGLETAYTLARQNFKKDGVNRILLATDGDFNIGTSAPGGVAAYVAQQRSSGVFLSVLGFGMGNYQDATMQAIAQNGNGVAAYIDSLSEARRVLSDELTSTMFTVAKDVKFQVEFNPAAVKSYRLLGYETRALRREDFNNDKVDAGEVGAGHEVTAIYEIVPVGTVLKEPNDSSLRYYSPAEGVDASSRKTDEARANELAFLRIRYKLPDAQTSQLIERPVTRADEKDSVAETSADTRFATAVAGFSRLLRGAQGVYNFGYADVATLAQSARGDDGNGERGRFIELVKNAGAIAGTQPKSREDGGVAFPPPQ